MTQPITQNAYLVSSGTGTIYPTRVFSRSPTPNDTKWTVGQRWLYQTAGVSVNITGASQANPCVITVANNQFSVGQIVLIQSVGGMTQLNGNYYTITAITSTSFTLNIDSTGFTAYTSGGTATVQVYLEYYLAGFITTNGAYQANWILLTESSTASGGGSGDVQTLTGDTGTATASANNINVYGNTSPASTGLTFTGSSSTLSLGGTLVVANGGTGKQSFTAYTVLCGGSSATGALQNVSGVGTSGQVLTSNGAGALPTWQSTAGNLLTITSVNHAASPYTVLSTDEFIKVDSSGGVVTINLPNAPTTGRIIYIKDAYGSSGTNNITVTTVGGAVSIDASTSFAMNSNYMSIGVIFDGSAYEVF